MKNKTNKVKHAINKILEGADIRKTISVVSEDDFEDGQDLMEEEMNAFLELLEKEDAKIKAIFAKHNPEKTMTYEFYGSEDSFSASVFLDIHFSSRFKGDDLQVYEIIGDINEEFDCNGELDFLGDTEKTCSVRMKTFEIDDYSPDFF